MQIRFRCGNCQSSVQVDLTHAGKRGKCPTCGTMLQIPSEEQIRASQQQAGSRHPATAAAPAGRGEDDLGGMPDYAPRFDEDDFEVEPPAPTSASVAPSPLPSYYHEEAAVRQVSYAGFWKRFVALFIDNFVLFGVSFVAGAIMGFVGVLVGVNQEAIVLAAQLMGFVVSWLYYALMEASAYQGTLGKLALGIKVVDLNGRPISFGRATGRYFAKFISTITLGIGYLMAAFTPKKQALHDMIASCLVVNR